MFLAMNCTLEKGQVVILPVAFDKTTSYGKGTDKGPAALLEASKYIELYDIETDTEMCRAGIHTAPELRPVTSEEMLKVTYEAVGQYIDQGKFVVTLGGEHSISYAPIRAHAEKYGSLSVLQLDAHSDLHPALGGNPYSHGSVMARVKTIPEVENVVAVGIRSMAEREKEEMEKEDVFFAHQLDGEAWMDQVIDRLSDRVYLSFDVDAFDSSLMPSTGTPEPGGLFWNPALKLLKKVIEKRSLVGFDVVELSPIPGMHAPDYLAAKLVYKILSYLFEPKDSRNGDR
ncbi:agmatinase [Simkania negevensis]|uniref:Agmatinase 1 n=1 Tax=Simkania negevensis (strain ATCC VR-1471 / DSM 27360 / Z) TaxID=331113 RepID=F8L6Y1_SIMNZ|nr:agmatinase [Simkania negevensis]MCB1074805.1 agmatinase [Simkania sp.]CCB88489.1 Agmatinase 1 [Simkania negevensis Z]